MLWIQRCLHWRVLFLTCFSWMALTTISFVQWKWACSEVGNAVWMGWCQPVNFHTSQHSMNAAGDSIRKGWSVLHCTMHYLIYAAAVTAGVAVGAAKWILWWWESWRRSEWILWPESAGTAGMDSRDLVLVALGPSLSVTVRKEWDPHGQMRQKHFCWSAGKAAEENFNVGMDRESWWMTQMREYWTRQTRDAWLGCCHGGERLWRDRMGRRGILSLGRGGKCGALPRDRGGGSREGMGCTGEQLMLGMLCWVSATDTWLMGRTSWSNCN